MKNPSMKRTSASSGTAGKPTPCCSKVGLKRGPWTPEEDEILSGYIRREGEGRWRTLPKRAGLLRCGKSCRLRWMNYLRPSVKRGQIAPDEEDLILRLHRLLGNRWSLIAGRIPGRTDNEIKNYWNTHLSKKLISQGIDPRTHKPLNSIPNSLAPAPAPAPATNPNPNSPGLEGGPSLNSIDDDGGTALDQMATTAPSSTPAVWQNSDGPTTAGIHGSANGIGNGDGENDMVYCTDEVFSSFFNSLMSEEMYSLHHHHNQPQDPLDPLVPSTPTFGNGSMWDASIFSRAHSRDTHQRPSSSLSEVDCCRVAAASLVWIGAIEVKCDSQSWSYTPIV